jgi:hypothetical protein
MIVANNSSIHSVRNHIGEGDNDRNYNSKRNYSTCDCSVLTFSLKPEQLIRIKEISHFYSLFKSIEDWHALF